MEVKEAVFHIKKFIWGCKAEHMDTEAEALQMAVDMMEEKERDREALEKLVYEREKKWEI